LLPEFGSSYGNQGLCALTNASALEVSYTMFGNHVRYVIPWSRDGLALIERYHDTRNLPFCSGRWQGDDTPTSFGSVCTSDEVYLSANTAELFQSKSICCHLPLKVH